MEAISPSLAVWLMTAVPTLGLASALLARLTERSVLQTTCQRLFYVTLCGVGAATACSLWFSTPAGLLCGATLSVMAVTAVCELRPAADLDAF